MDNYYEVRRDGRALASFVGDGAANAAFAWLLRHQPSSVHHATTYEGYEIVGGCA